jgi:hypothetical protein
LVFITILTPFKEAFLTQRLYLEKLSFICKNSSIGVKKVIRLVGFMGFKGSGKTAAATYLETVLHWKKFTLAGPLKDMLIAMGLSDFHVNGGGKEHPLEMLCGQTPRHAMQTLGTEWGRVLIGGDIWVNVLKKQLHTHLDISVRNKACIEDVRFPNEFKLIKDLGGIVVKIERPGLVSDGHVSENFVESAIPDQTIDNSGSLDDFLNQITTLNQLEQY